MSQDPKNQSLRETLGATAREARQRLGLTQEDVADRLRMAPEVYGRMERGATAPSVFTLRKLCVALSFSADKALSLGGDSPSALPAPHPEQPEARHMRRLFRRVQKLTPHSIRLLCQVAAMLPKKPVTRPKRPRV
ncbi:helix-turn-helix transcriptional regulator [Archangium sp.]|uniref:helix-turn-helix domain-containing protein n=1 Tax=Archangium sp. TaxID=1872627 RepID=UPI00286B8B11|nr:helix-turn-helix transcriptional regulator [Archangium sp.]